MTELQQARADYIAALEREQRLFQENAELKRELYDLRTKFLQSAVERYAASMGKLWRLAVMG